MRVRSTYRDATRINDVESLLVELAPLVLEGECPVDDDVNLLGPVGNGLLDLLQYRKALSRICEYFFDPISG